MLKWVAEGGTNLGESFIVIIVVYWELCLCTVGGHQHLSSQFLFLSATFKKKSTSKSILLDEHWENCGIITTSSHHVCCCKCVFRGVNSAGPFTLSKMPTSWLHALEMELASRPVDTSPIKLLLSSRQLHLLILLPNCILEASYLAKFTLAVSNNTHNVSVPHRKVPLWCL